SRPQRPTLLASPGTAPTCGTPTRPPAPSTRSTRPPVACSPRSRHRVPPPPPGSRGTAPTCASSPPGPSTRSPRPTRRTPLPPPGNASPLGLAWDGTNLWLVASRTIYKIDPATGNVLTSFPEPGRGATTIAFDGTDLWVADATTGLAYRMDPDTGAVLQAAVL